jgi:hypothetical protein
VTKHEEYTHNPRSKSINDVPSRIIGGYMDSNSKVSKLSKISSSIENMNGYINSMRSNDFDQLGKNTSPRIFHKIEALENERELLYNENLKLKGKVKNLENDLSILEREKEEHLMLIEKLQKEMKELLKNKENQHTASKQTSFYDKSATPISAGQRNWSFLQKSEVFSGQKGLTNNNLVEFFENEEELESERKILKEVNFEKTKSI